MLESLIQSAKAKGASDLHLEVGLPPVMRIGGELIYRGDPLEANTVLDISRGLIGDGNWPHFLERGSYDLSVDIADTRCRVNIFKTLRGISLAIRVFSAFQPTLKKLNLHPDLMEILRHPHGLVIISGPTGSGKSSTMAALIQEINLRQSKHIITIESPIEYLFRIQRSFIRQREVGRDTPTFSQALIDAMREDPDVLMVGEMREPEVMRQTLNAAETGHLVLTTIHSGSVTEAMQRIVGAFPAEIQDGVRTLLADSLLAIVCQRLVYLPRLNIRVPECEIIFSNYTVKSVIREGKYFKINDIVQTGAQEKMWSFSRYRTWMDNRTDWYTGGAEELSGPIDAEVSSPQRPLLRKPKPPKTARSVARPQQAINTLRPQRKKAGPPQFKETIQTTEGYYEIGDIGSDSAEDILKELKNLKKK